MTTRRPRPAPSPPEPPAPTDLSVETFTCAGEELALFTWSAEAAPSSLPPGLAEVLALVSEGLTNAEIASRRRTSVRTVAHQVATLFRRFGVASRVELIRKRRAPAR